jgi:hypothetical protein
VEADRAKLIKEVKQSATKGLRDANRVVAKLAGLELSLESMAKPLQIHKDIPPFALESVKDCFADVKAKLNEAKDTVRGKKKGLLTFDYADVDAADKKAKQAIALLTTMITSVQKHKG